MNEWLRLIETHDPRGAALLDRQEMVWVAALDTQGVRKLERVAQGGCSRVDVHLAPLLAVPLVAGVDRFTLLHNHPGGMLAASTHDKELTRHVLRAATLCGLVMEDHIIVAGARSMSMVAAGLLEAAPPLVARAAQ